MGNKPPKQNTEWTEEMNQYIVKNYLLKGIRAVAKDLGRTKDAVRSHISTLRNEGYFDNMFDGLSREKLIFYIHTMQEFHYDLLNDFNKREEETKKWIEMNLEMHHLIYTQLLKDVMEDKKKV